MCQATPSQRSGSKIRSALCNITNKCKDKVIHTKKTFDKKRKKSVRFNLRATTRPIKVSSKPYLTWLSPEDYKSIRENVLATLDLMELEADGFKVMPEYYLHYCTRGLEAYSTETKAEKGSFKPDVIFRRRNRTRSVLFEQEMQRRCNKGKDFHDVVEMRKACITRYDRANTLKAIELGLNDSEAARAVHAEK